MSLPRLRITVAIALMTAATLFLGFDSVAGAQTDCPTTTTTTTAPTTTTTAPDNGSNGSNGSAAASVVGQSAQGVAVPFQADCPSTTPDLPVTGGDALLAGMFAIGLTGAALGLRRLARTSI